MLIPATEVAEFVSWKERPSLAGEWPVYVDFESSILDRDELVRRNGASVLPRGPGLKARIRHLIRWMTLPEGVIRANLDRLTRILLKEHARPTVLVVGGGSIGIGMETIYRHPDIRVLAFDIYGDDNVQFVADAHDIPLYDGSVDCVVVQAVLEHVLDPWKVVHEIHRVLKPDGLVYAETPFLQQVHEGPYDFTRFTESGHRWLFKSFSRVDSGAVTGPGVQLIWAIESVVEGVFRSRRMAVIASVAVFWLRYLDRVIPERYQIDDACCVYFLGRRAETPLAARDMPGHYRGAQHREMCDAKDDER